MGAFGRSWELTKLSFGVIGKDKELLLFPVVGGIMSVLFMIALLFPRFISKIISGEEPNLQGSGLTFLFLTYLILAFIATFFNVCAVYTIKKRFEGGDATFGESISFAFSRVHLIFYWSLLSATVGILLRLLDKMAERMGQGGQLLMKIINSMLGIAWSVSTLFVIPAMVYYNLGPIDAIKRSVQTLRSTWGESIIRHFGLGFIKGIFVILGIVVLLLTIFMTSSPAVIWTMLIVIAVYILLVILVFGVANTVFNTALFVYAETGKIPSGFSKDSLQNSFESARSAV